MEGQDTFKHVLYMASGYTIAITTVDIKINYIKTFPIARQKLEFANENKIF